MSLSCVLRSIPSSLKGCIMGYGNSQFLRTCAVLTSSAFNKSQHGHLPVFDSKFALASRLLPNQCQVWDLQPKVNFSVSSKEKENHSKLWSAERILSLALLGIVPVAFLAPSQPVECLMAVSLVMHNHWGIEAVVVDYVRPILFGPVIPKIAHGLVYAMSIVTLVGLFYLIFDGCGIVNAVQLMWRL